MQAVIATPQPSWLNHPPCPVGDDLSNANTLVPKGRRKLILIGVRAKEHDGHRNLSWLRLGANDAEPLLFSVPRSCHDPPRWNSIPIGGTRTIAEA